MTAHTGVSGRPRTVHVVVTCTSRKTLPVPPALRLDSLSSLGTAPRAREWAARLAGISSMPLIAAQDLYAGEHWMIARGLAARARYTRARLWVSSAGYGLIEMDTFVRHEIPVICLVGNDAGWTQIAREQVEILEDDIGTVLLPTDYHRAAEGLGAAGLHLEDPAEIGAVLDRARDLAAEGRPVVINARLGSTDFRKGSISM